MSLTARLAIAPIAWTNDDLPELGGATPLETCLAEMKLAGFAGSELGGKFPREAGALMAVLAKHGLALASGWYSGTLLDGDLETEKKKIAPQLALFKAMGAPVIVYGETSRTVQGRRDAPIASRPRLAREQFKPYGERMTALARHCHAAGVALTFHHHMGTAIETEEDIDRLMAATGEEVGLLFDTGHITFAGGDALAMARRHAKRINHVHAKDIRKAVLAGLDFRRTSFLDAVLAGVFTVPGDGMIDFKAVAKLLAGIGYSGWIVVEAEQDPAKAEPLTYARIGHKALKAALIGAGYRILA